MRTLILFLASTALVACSPEPSDNNVSNNGSNNAVNGTTNNLSNGATNGDADMGVDAATDIGPGSPLPDWCTGQPEEFSFFVTSMDALWALSGSEPGDLTGGFGGDFGGIAGADEICQTIGEATGSTKTWRAFLSATDDGSGNPIHAIERIGEGPWTDANGRLVASGIDGMLAADRPDGDAQSVADLPDECGVPISILGDAHDVVTGSNKQGRLNSAELESTCNDWTSSDGAVGSLGGDNMIPGLSGTVMCGHSFPRSGGGGRFGGANWISDHPLRGCGKGANLASDGAGEGTCIGCTGGYGALYCFAL